MSHDVFVSYSSKDKPTADAACATLEARGIRCWIAPRDIVPGMDWTESIIDAIVGCRLTVLILSAHSNLSEQVKREVTMAVGEGKILIPLRIDEVLLSKHMRYFLSTPHWLDAMTPPLERHLQVLAATVQQFLAKNEQVSATAAPVPVTGTGAAATSKGAAVGRRESVRDEPKVITNSIGMKLARIPAGEFLMGSPDSDKDADDSEGPQHRVRITQPFYLGVYPVTQKEYEMVMGWNPSRFSAQGSHKDFVVGQDTGSHPVESVSWHDAIEFCNKLSEREGIKPYYQFGTGVQSGGDGYQLPTEAQWEYACRAGSTSLYYFGDDRARLSTFAWVADNSGRDAWDSDRFWDECGKAFQKYTAEVERHGCRTHSLGQKHPNAFGLFDMHGNVWEWCWDGFDAAYYASSPGVDPYGTSQADLRVFRGGGWNGYPRSCRSAFRGRGTPDFRVNYLGFRLARALSSR